MFSRVAVVALIGGLAAACSDSSRLSGNPFSNPFSSGGDVEQTASIQPQSQPQYGAPQPIAPVSSQPLQPVANAAGGGWTAAGGTSIMVSQGDSLNTISNRYGVPTNAILSANGLTSPSQVTPGRSIVIPVYSVNAPAARVAAAPVVTAPAAPRAPNVAPAKAFAPVPPTPPVVARAPAQNLANIKQTADAKLAATKNVLQKPGQALAAKETTLNSKAQQLATAKTQQVEQAKAAATQKLQQPVQSAAFEPPAKAAPAPAPAVQRDADQTASLQNTGKSSAEFRWPAKGRVISGFGSGNGNEGINISVPEGTPVRAAEAGMVTFAGDDVKSYGNLVLIKHDNGYISAYAHNGKLNVKRGDRVTRGQEIARSGQSGDVTSPQLHFEIRKGAQPVDPVPYLGG